jgi:hypothetical protein
MFCRSVIKFRALLVRAGTTVRSFDPHIVKTGRLEGRLDGSWAAEGRERDPFISLPEDRKILRFTVFFIISELACAIVIERAIHPFAQLGMVILEFL